MKAKESENNQAQNDIYANDQDLPENFEQLTTE